MSNIKKTPKREGACLFQPFSWSVPTILRDSVVTFAIVRKRPRALNTASHDSYEEINPGFLFSFLYGYGAPLGGPSGAPL